MSDSASQLQNKAVRYSYELGFRTAAKIMAACFLGGGNAQDEPLFSTREGEGREAFSTRKKS